MHGKLSALERQAAICRAMGSPFAAEVLDAAARVLDNATLTGLTVLGWPGDPDKAAVALRLGGGLHALARERSCLALTALYDAKSGDFDAAVREAVASHDAWLADWLASPPQTNEIGRSAAVMAGLMTIAARTGRTIELLEIGASAGLNLNLDRYAFDLGGVSAGDAASPISIAPEWRGPPPPHAPVSIAGRRGCDVAPLDAADPETATRLIAFVWADRPERIARLEAAIGLAARHPPVVDRADAVAWLAQRLARPQAAGVARVVFHTIVLQYLTRQARAEVGALVEAAGTRATPERPLAWLAFEWDGERSLVELVLRLWPGGGETLLATAHPHASWIAWTGA